MRHLKCYPFIVGLLSLCVSQGLLSTEKAESSAIITVHNVGQGNCIDIALSATGEEKDTEYMLIDIGSSAYQKEWHYTEQQAGSKKVKLKVESKVSVSVKQEKPKEKKKSRPSIVTPSDYLETVKNFTKSNSEGFIAAMRGKFSAKETENKNIVKVKTVIITHPDKDHYGWLMDLFVDSSDHIEYLILAGLPENYDQSEKLNFKDWIQQRLKNGTKVFFPAIQTTPISQAQLDGNLLKTQHETFENHWYPELGAFSKDFEEAFNFGGSIKVYLLSINPTHFQGQNGTLRMSSPEDDNSDSLVLKIENGKSSAILTGDATYLTTTRILDVYGKDLPFLQTNILLASHHGSATHGSNNEEWIKATQPQYVLISNGYFQGHPQSDAYEMFKKSDRLKFVSDHHVLVGKTDDFKEGSLHTTKRAIFSTLNSGTLTCNLMTDGSVKLATKTNGDIKELPNLRNYKEEILDEVTVEEKEDKIIATPTRKNEANSRTASTTTSAIPLSDSTLGEGEKTLSQGLSSKKKEAVVTTAKRKRNE